MNKHDLNKYYLYNAFIYERERKKEKRKLLNIGEGGKVKNFLRRVIINKIYNHKNVLKKFFSKIKYVDMFITMKNFAPNRTSLSSSRW